MLTLEQRVERLEKLVSRLPLGKKKETWVKVSVITKLTGWNKEEMKQARENGYLRFKKEDGKITYHLESLSPVFFKSL